MNAFKPDSRFNFGVGGVASREDMLALGREWKWLFTMGLIFAVLGIFSFFVPVATTFALTVAVGSLLTVSGVIQLVHAFQLRHFQGSGMRFAHSILSLVAGLLMLRYPAGGLLGIALAMSFYFFLSAAAQGAMALEMRPHKGWGWGILGAASSFVLGAYMIWTFPFSALWVPGLLLGLNLLMTGAGWMVFALAIRQPRQKKGEVRPMQPARPA